ncbi:MAG: hypothetical protein ABI539_07115 [Acidobacteriota bacterium]
MRSDTSHFEDAGSGAFTFDTTFVLFFLAIDFGQSLFTNGLDAAVTGLMLLVLVSAPYFLVSPMYRERFWNWLSGRILIAGFGSVLGMAFHQSLGVFLPDYFRFVPLTMLITAVIIGSYAQFHGILRFRLAK